MLTRRRRSARRTLTVNTTAQPRNDASSARKSNTCICQYRWKPLCCRRFRNFASRDAGIIAPVATRQRQPKAPRTDSESQLLAMKKFSRSAASRLIGARQNRFFARIAKTDSRTVFSPARTVVGRCGRIETCSRTRSAVRDRFNLNAKFRCRVSP